MLWLWIVGGTGLVAVAVVVVVWFAPPPSD